MNTMEIKPPQNAEIRYYFIEFVGVCPQNLNLREMLSMKICEILASRLNRFPLTQANDPDYM
jgi:hypothetical protein